MRKVFDSVEDTGTGIVSLFFMFGSFQHLVDYLSHMGSHCSCPASVVIAVFGVDFFILKVFRFHILIIRNVLGKRSIGPAVFTDQFVILIANADFGCCCF